MNSAWESVAGLKSASISRWFPTAARLLVLLVVAGAILTIANLAPGVLQLGTASDKLNHIIAFAILAPVTVLALPRAGVLQILVGLMLFNALVELSQAILQMGRQADPLDWVAGVLGTLPCLLVVAICRNGRAG